LVIFFLFFVEGKSQDPVFSQFYNNFLQINPAYAGSQDYNRAYMQYRNQWPALGNAYVTYCGAYDQYVDKLHGGIGVDMMKDVVANGIFSSFSADLMYSFHFRITKSIEAKTALQASFLNQGLNLSSADYPDIQENIPSRNSSAIDFTAGTLITLNNSLDIGVSLSHLTNNFTDPVLRVPLKITLHASKEITPKSNGYSIHPAIIIQKQSNFFQTNYGLYLYKKPICAGIWLRQNSFLYFSALIFSIGYSVEAVKIDYSYDFNLFRSTNLFDFGAHEISITYKFGNKDTRKKRMNAIKCTKI
jgi:type IX secretion system PorP/SprF family membrane protein